MNKNTCTFLNGHGDLTIEWNVSEHSKMVELLEKKINDGFLIYVVESSFLGLKKTKKVLTKENKQELLKNRNIRILDEDVKDFFLENKSVSLKNNNENEVFNIKKMANKEDLKQTNNSFVVTKPPIAG
jgi:hypothetical protein